MSRKNSKIRPAEIISIRVLRLFRRLIKIVGPSEILMISEWAEKYRVLSKEASVEPGKWNLDRAVYQQGMMDAISDPNTETVVFMTSAQVGKTEILLNIIGYYMDYDPSPILFVLPTKEAAETLSKDRIAPMIQDTPVLREKVQEAKSRNSDNTIFHKKFPGGQLNLVGANSPTSLSSKPIKVVLMDEVDRFPESAGSEGDPYSLAEKRTTTFWNRKIIATSTPTVKGSSRIEKEYNNSTKEQWQVPCPRCGYYQPLEWPRIKFPDDEFLRPTMKCSCCDERFYEKDWKDNFQHGKWVARQISKVRGFHINELSSPWKSWEKIIEEFKKANHDGQETLKVWINTALGEAWEDQGNGAEEDTLMDRRFTYGADIPKGALVLTAGVDVQDDRFEVEIVGWNRNYESWGIVYNKIFGDLSKDEPWDRLEKYLEQDLFYDDGTSLNIASVCLDTGGHFTDEAYKFCKKMKAKHKNIFGIKGMGKDGIPFIHMVSKNNEFEVPIYILGVNAGKESLLLRIKTKEEGPGYCHFPSDAKKGYDKTYFSGLTSEYKSYVKIKGKYQFKWIVKSGCRNEPFDLRNYATAALEIISPIAWDVLESKLARGENYMKKKSKAKQHRTGAINKGIEV